MKLQKLILIAASSIFLVHQIFASTNSQVQIKHIIVGPQAGDKPSNFSINILLKNGSTNLNNWQFGFYMPRNFRTVNTSNLNLDMKVCEVQTGKCSKLIYQKAYFTNRDASTMFTTIVKPQGGFSLKAGKSYQISLLHNSSQGPQNYSSLPQSLFIITDNKIINLATSPAIYRITNYDSKLNHQLALKRINNNWLNSNNEIPALNIVPTPEQIIPAIGKPPFQINKNIIIHNLAKIAPEQLELWQQALKNDFTITTTIDNDSANTGIILQNASAPDSPEGYKIIIDAAQIKISATNPAGFFYALQTLRQLWFNNKTLPAITIKDNPRFKYRGVMLDVARHYFTVSQLKNFIDIMASAKLNTLHLHLSDDEAFRLELDKYPKLGQVAAWRGYGKQIGPLAFPQQNLGRNGNYSVAKADDEYGGGYDKSDIKDLIAYANTRQITIIPEIDIPAHSRALMKALPGDFFEADDSSEYGGYGDNTLPVCAFNSKTDFGQKFTTNLINILNQSEELFNHQTTLYAINKELGIGGDEVLKGTWSKSPACAAAPWNTKDEPEKEHYFFSLLSQANKIDQLKLSGWHEFLMDNSGKINNNNLSTKQIAHVWVWGNSKDAQAKAINLANNNYPVVLAYSDLLYMDLTYTPKINEPGLYWATKTNDTYALLYSAIAANQTIKATTKPEQILGIEAALWTDVVPSYTQLYYMTLPKISGLAEAAWNSNSKDWAIAPAWRSLAQRLGCGKAGYLAYINQRFGANYRGYPNGIRLEAPAQCLTQT